MKIFRASYSLHILVHLFSAHACKSLGANYSYLAISCIAITTLEIHFARLPLHPRNNLLY